MTSARRGKALQVKQVRGEDGPGWILGRVECVELARSEKKKKKSLQPRAEKVGPNEGQEREVSP